jgi:hypothetical protein
MVSSFLNQKWEHLAMIHDYEIMVRELAKEMGMVGAMLLG